MPSFPSQKSSAAHSKVITVVLYCVVICRGAGGRPAVTFAKPAQAFKQSALNCPHLIIRRLKDGYQQSLPSGQHITCATASGSWNGYLNFHVGPIGNQPSGPPDLLCFHPSSLVSRVDKYLSDSPHSPPAPTRLCSIGLTASCACNPLVILARAVLLQPSVGAYPRQTRGEKSLPLTHDR
jgi:hypothetical protein